MPQHSRRGRKVPVERPAWNSDTEVGDGLASDCSNFTSSPTATATGHCKALYVEEELEQEHFEKAQPSSPPVPAVHTANPLEALFLEAASRAARSSEHIDEILDIARQPTPMPNHERSLQSDAELVWLIAEQNHASPSGEQDPAGTKSCSTSPQHQLQTSAIRISPEVASGMGMAPREQGHILHEMEARLLKLQEELHAQQAQQEAHRCSWEAEVERKEAELKAVAEQQRVEGQRLECEQAALVERESDLAKQAQELSKRESELATEQGALKEQQAALVTEQRILESRSKNLGFNVKRKYNEVEQKKERLVKDVMQEVEVEKKKHLEDLEREKEAARIEALQHQEALDMETALAMAQVEKEKRRVEDQKRKTEQAKQEAMELALGVKAPAPAHWKNQKMEPTLDVMVPCRRDSQVLLDLLRASALHTSCHGRDGVFEVCKIKKVHAWRIENPILWRQYISKGEELRSRHQVNGTRCKPVDPQVPEHVVPQLPSYLKWRSSGKFDASTNEVLLWHGTKSAIIDTIVKQGFDERVCSLSGMFGAGLYFAQDSCKSGQYAEADRSKSHWFLLCRVRLGRPYYATETMQNERKAPDGFDSVVFNPGQGHVPVGQHRELIIYDRYQAYPEYVVRAFL